MADPLHERLVHQVLKSIQNNFNVQHANLSPEERQTQWVNFVLTTSGSGMSSTATNCSSTKHSQSSDDCVGGTNLAPPPKRRCVQANTEMSRLQSSPLPTCQGYSAQPASSCLPTDSEAMPVIPDYGNWDSVMSATKAYPKARQEPCRRRRSAVGKVPQSIAVDEFDPNEYFASDHASDQLSPLPNLNANRLSGEYGFGSFAAMGAQSLVPPSTSPLSSSSGTSLTAWTAPTSIGMGRQDSMGNSSFCKNMNMMRLDSQASNANSSFGDQATISPHLSGGEFMSSRSQVPQDTSVDTLHNVSHAGGGISATDTSHQTNIDVLNLYQDADTAMSRSESRKSWNRYPSSVSTVKESSLPMQRQTSSSSRRIEPKPESSVAMSRDPSSRESYEMVRVPSSDGSYRTAVKIAKAAPLERPTSDKVKCDFPGCTKKPDGYKGEHEMRRHYERAHGAVRTVYVCAPLADNPDFLSQCKRCTGGQTYNAEYNAGEHLRRIHFNPRPQKTRKGPIPDKEKRGGKSGGSEPKMEVLRNYMIIYDVNQDDERVSTPRRLVEDSNVIMPDFVDASPQVDDAGKDSISPVMPSSSMSPPAVDCSMSGVESNTRNFDPNDPPLSLFDDSLLYDMQPPQHHYSGLDDYFPTF